MTATTRPDPRPDLALDPILIAAVTFSVDRCVARVNATVAPPATRDLPALWQYWQRASTLTGDDLALQVASELPIGAFGMVSYQAVSAPNLREALEVVGRDYLGKLIPGMTMSVVPVSREHTEIRVEGTGDDVMIPMLEEIVLAVTFRHLPLMSAAARVQAVTLRRQGPTVTSTAPWRTFFGVPPRFAQRRSALRLASSDLSIELRTANPEVHQLVRGADPPGATEPIVSRLEAHLRTRIGQPLDAAAIAAALGLTARTLQRRLQQERTSLRDVAAAVRIAVAREMLEKTECTIAEIAAAVGFSQPASFSRAFAAATGETPQACRKRLV